MGDNRWNRFESKCSPLKSLSETNFGSSEYSCAYTPCDSSTNVEAPARTGTAIRQTDSEYNKSFGPKAPYSKPNKPVWMLNHNKSCFDLKIDPDAKFEGTTSYMETFKTKKDEEKVEEIKSNNVKPETDKIENLDTSSKEPTLVIIGDTHILCKSSGDATTSAEITIEHKEPASSSEPSFSDATAVIENSVDSLPEQNDPQIRHPASMESKPHHHGRKKVDNCPSLNATPGLRFFMKSISRQ